MNTSLRRGSECATATVIVFVVLTVPNRQLWRCNAACAGVESRRDEKKLNRPPQSRLPTTSVSGVGAQRRLPRRLNLFGTGPGGRLTGGGGADRFVARHGLAAWLSRRHTALVVVVEHSSQLEVRDWRFLFNVVCSA